MDNNSVSLHIFFFEKTSLGGLEMVELNFLVD